MLDMQRTGKGAPADLSRRNGFKGNLCESNKRKEGGKGICNGKNNHRVVSESNVNVCKEERGRKAKTQKNRLFDRPNPVPGKSNQTNAMKRPTFHKGIQSAKMKTGRLQNGTEENEIAPVTQNARHPEAHPTNRRNRYKQNSEIDSDNSGRKEFFDT